MPEILFNNKRIVLTDPASNFGLECSAWLAATGAKFGLNQPTRKNEIESSVGRSAVACQILGSCRDIVDVAIKELGGVDVLISNGEFQRSDRFDVIEDEELWKTMLDVTLKSAYKCAKAVWPYFREQGYGRIIFLSQRSRAPKITQRVAESAAKMALLGLAETLAKEGAKYNIKVNVVATSSPAFITASSGSAFSAPSTQDLVQLIGLLCHDTSIKESGSVFEVAPGRISKLRWQRAEGAFLNPDKEFTPGALLKRWAIVNDFSRASYPQGPGNIALILPKTQELPPNDTGIDLDFSDKVVVITGAGSGLGRAYAIAFSRAGAKVVVNDLKDPKSVVNEIGANGGNAVASIASVNDCEAVIKTAIDAYGRLDLLVNNAGFVRDKSFANMTDAIWDPIIAVHLDGTYQMTKAAWPHFVKQNYGRVVNTTSTSGIYGNFGQSNYAAAKLGILGLSDAFAHEGLGHNIHVNTIAPIASTSALAAAIDGTPGAEEQVQFKPEYICPMVMLLCSDKLSGTPSATGGLYEVSCGWHARTRLQRSLSHNLSLGSSLSAKELSRSWDATVSFPAHGTSDSAPAQKTRPRTSKEILENIERLKLTEASRTEYAYTEKEVMLYNLAIGATSSELHLVYERSPKFQALPTFGLIPFFSPMVVYHNAEIVPYFDPARSLLGEHYLEIRKYPIPITGRLISTSKLLDVVDKGGAAISITAYTTRDSITCEELFYNEVQFFMRGAGGFTSQGRHKANTETAVLASTQPQRRAVVQPKREPDAIILQKTSTEQAVLYRLTGDRMEMHIDPAFSARGGFPEPILHGACFMGMAGKHLYQTYGPFRSIKVRFAGVVIPGQTLKTEMWRERESKSVMFQMTVVETGKMCIVGGHAVLLEGSEGENVRAEILSGWAVGEMPNEYERLLRGAS